MDDPVELPPRLPESAEPTTAAANEPANDEKEEDFRLRASSALSAHVVEKAKEPPDKKEEWLKNLGSENIWFDKSEVSGAECDHFAQIAKNNKEGKTIESEPKSSKGAEKPAFYQDPIWNERSAVLDAEKEYQENLALERKNYQSYSAAEETGWVENLKREFVWLDRLEVLEAEKNHYAMLAKGQAEYSEVSNLN